MKRILLVGVLLLTMYGNVLASDAIPPPVTTPQSTYVKEVDKWLQYFMSKTFNSTDDALRVYEASPPEWQWAQIMPTLGGGGTLNATTLDSTEVFSGSLYLLKSFAVTYTTPAAGLDSLYVELRGHTTVDVGGGIYITRYKLTKQPTRLGGGLPYKGWIINLTDVPPFPYYSCLVYNPTVVNIAGLAVYFGGRP